MTIFYGITQWIISVWEIFLCYFFCYIVMDRGWTKRNKAYVGGWSIVIGTLLDINRYLAFMSWFMIIFQCFLIFISLTRKGTNKIYCLGVIMTYNVFVALLQLFNVFVLLVFNRQINVDDIYYEQNVYRMICYIFTLLIIYGMLMGLRRYKKSIDVNLEILKWGLLTYGATGIFVVFIFQEQMLTYGKSASMKNTIFLSFIIVITLITFFLCIRALVSRSEYQMLKFKNKIMEDHYQEIYQMYQNCACTIHDFKNHLLLLEDYCKLGQCQKALTYIEKIKKPLCNIKSYIKSGNNVVDLILNIKIAEAKDKGIAVEIKIDRMCDLSIEENDLCSIFSNLVDNAIEACDSIIQGRKWIKISSVIQGDMLVVKIANSYGNEIYEEQGGLCTSKNGMHGYGMKSIQLNVEKYGGNVRWSYTDDVFMVVVTFFSVVKSNKLF